MNSNSFTQYLFENFAYLICTPLCTYLYNFIIEIWFNKDFSFMKDFPIEQKKIMIHIIYEKNPKKYLDYMSLDDEKNKHITKFINDIREDIKYPKEFPKKNNKFNDNLFKSIYSKILCYKINPFFFATLLSEIEKINKNLNNSFIPKYLIEALNNYYDIILGEVVKLDDFIDTEKVTFIKNYLDLVYDTHNDKLLLDEIKYVINKKIDDFYEKIKNDKMSIKYKCDIYLSILNKWIDVYDKGDKIIKIKLYPNNDSYEEINIYQDICNLGEKNLIKLVSPIIREMSINEKKNILNKMSSGTKKECEIFFLNKFEIEEKLSEISKDKKFIDRIKITKLNDKNDFNKQINTFVDEINKLISDSNI